MRKSAAISRQLKDGMRRFTHLQQGGQRLLGELAVRGEAGIASLQARIDLASRTRSFGERAERSGTEAIARLSELSHRAVGRLGLASAEELRSLAEQVHRLEERLEKLGQSEKNRRRHAEGGGAPNGVRPPL